MRGGDGRVVLESRSVDRRGIDHDPVGERAARGPLHIAQVPGDRIAQHRATARTAHEADPRRQEVGQLRAHGHTVRVVGVREAVSDDLARIRQRRAGLDHTQVRVAAGGQRHVDLHLAQRRLPAHRERTAGEIMRPGGHLRAEFDEAVGVGQRHREHIRPNVSRRTGQRRRRHHGHAGRGHEGEQVLQARPHSPSRGLGVIKVEGDDLVAPGCESAGRQVHPKGDQIQLLPVRHVAARPVGAAKGQALQLRIERCVREPCLRLQTRGEAHGREFKSSADKVLGENIPDRVEIAVGIGGEFPRIVSRAGAGAGDLHDPVANNFAGPEPSAGDVHH